MIAKDKDISEHYDEKALDSVNEKCDEYSMITLIPDELSRG